MSFQGNGVVDALFDASWLHGFPSMFGSVQTYCGSIGMVMQTKNKSTKKERSDDDQSQMKTGDIIYDKYFQLHCSAQFWTSVYETEVNAKV